MSVIYELHSLLIAKCMQCENIDVNPSLMTFMLPGIEMTHHWCSLDTFGVRAGKGLVVLPW